MQNKLLRKIFILSLSMLIILTIYTIPTLSNNNVLRTNLEIEDITSINTNSIYLLNKDKYLVQTDIFIDKKKIEEEARDIINYLTIDNNKIPSGLKGYLHKNIKVLKINRNNDLLEIDFNKYLNEDEKTITGIVNSLLEIKGINKIKITKEGKELSNYNFILDKNIGINNDYSYTTRRDLKKIVVYYLDKINDEYYYVPVTKYIDKSESSIEVIINELKNNKELISVVNSKLKLINFYEEENVLYLNFNEYLENDLDIDEISKSIFASIDINMISFEVNNKKITYRKRD